MLLQVVQRAQTDYWNIRIVYRIRTVFLLFKCFCTNHAIATSIVHSKLDYCNSLYYGLPKYQINRLQHIQNSLARTVVQAPKFQHITPILKSLNWLKVSERIEYKIISLTKFSIPLSLRIYMTSYLVSLLTVTTHALHLMSLLSNHHHRSKSLHRSFRHASPHLWNQLPTSLRIPRPNYSPPPSQRFGHAGLTCYTLLSPSITFSLFHSELKAYLFRKSYPPP